MITNLHGEVEYVNDAFRHIGRIKAGIQPGVLFTDVVGEDSQFYKNLRDVLMMSGVSRREFKYVTAADEVWVDLSVNPIKDEKGLIRSYLITVTDITERKRIEAAASKNRHRYDALFNSSNDGVFILDLSGNIQEVNQKGAGFAGVHNFRVGWQAFRNVKSQLYDIRYAANRGRHFPQKLTYPSEEVDCKRWHQDTC